MITIPGKSAVREFEYKISEYCNTEYSVSVCNASIGIMGAFYALGLSKQEIITTPLSWPGAISGLRMLGCKLKFCDVEKETLTINPLKLEKQITARTKAVFTADYLGYPAKLDEMKIICKKHNLLLIHDAANSFGSKYRNFFSGHFADVSIFSFGAKKLFTVGEGGCIVTNNKTINNDIVKHLSHPEIQSLKLDVQNPFALNTNINHIAADYGVKTFRQQIESIEERERNISAILKQYKLGNKNELTKPNYFKIIVKNKDITHIKNNILLSIEKLPFQKLIYQEDAFLNSNESFKCVIAEAALNNFSILKLIA